MRILRFQDALRGPLPGRGRSEGVPVDAILDCGGLVASLTVVYPGTTDDIDMAVTQVTHSSAWRSLHSVTHSSGHEFKWSRFQVRATCWAGPIGGPCEAGACSEPGVPKTIPLGGGWGDVTPDLLNNFRGSRGRPELPSLYPDEGQPSLCPDDCPDYQGNRCACWLLRRFQNHSKGIFVRGSGEQ